MKFLPFLNIILRLDFIVRSAYFFSADDNFVKYLYVAILSLVQTSSPTRSYEIVVLHTCKDTSVLDQIQSDLTRPNISIRIIDANSLIDRLKKVKIIGKQWTLPTYFRCFIPEMFPEYDRGIYLDLDIIIRHDIGELMDTDLKGNMLAAVPDVIGDWHNTRTFNEKVRALIPEYRLYFNTAVMVMDLKKLREAEFPQKCQEFLDWLNGRAIDGNDNTVFCRLFATNNWKVTQLDMNWMCCPCKLLEPMDDADRCEFLTRRLPTEYGEPITDFWTDPKLIHYLRSGPCKPWNYNNPKKAPFAKYWWEVAKETPFYNEFRETLKHYKVPRLMDDLIRHRRIEIFNYQNVL